MILIAYANMLYLVIDSVESSKARAVAVGGFRNTFSVA
jgi:hypothetical protein